MFDFGGNLLLDRPIQLGWEATESIYKYVLEQTRLVTRGCSVVFTRLNMVEPPTLRKIMFAWVWGV